MENLEKFQIKELSLNEVKKNSGGLVLPYIPPSPNILLLAIISETKRGWDAYWAL